MTWSFPDDGSLFRFIEGVEKAAALRVLVEDPPGLLDEPEAQRGKACLAGWPPVKLPDGTRGAGHGASSLLRAS